jgi:hypothetical protein
VRWEGLGSITGRELADVDVKVTNVPRVVKWIRTGDKEAVRMQGG